MHTDIRLRNKSTTTGLASRYTERVSGSDIAHECRVGCGTMLLADVQRMADVTFSKLAASAHQFWPDGVLVVSRQIEASTV